MPVFTVHHTTLYRYRREVAFGPHRMMFLPQEGHDQRVLAFDLKIAPEPAGIRWSNDVLGNKIAVARFRDRASELRFDSRFTLEHFPSHPDDLGVALHAQTCPFALRESEAADLASYVRSTHRDPEGGIAAFAQGFINAEGATPTLAMLTAMNAAIREGFLYSRRVEKGIQEPAETLRLKRGTCRDFSVLMMAAVRTLGLPARFVSGYLYVSSRDVTGLQGGGSTHAWLQVYLPGAAWIDFDPTNAIVGNDGLIRVAVARLPEEALPLHGTFSGSAEDDLGMEISVVVKHQQAERDRFASVGVA